MSTCDHYTTPVPAGTWDVPAAGATRFSWEYDNGRDRLLSLYQRGLTGVAGPAAWLVRWEAWTPWTASSVSCSRPTGSRASCGAAR